MSEQDDIDFTKLSLEERLSNKLWKARVHGYEQLAENFQKRANSPEAAVHWRDPSMFQQYLADPNVIAQEKAIVALSTLLDSYYNGNISIPNNANLPLVYSSWLPTLVEKGLSSTRNLTKVNSLNCILKVTTFDQSILQPIEILLPILTNSKLPKVIIAALTALTELIKSFSFVNIDLNFLLQQLLENLPKLASHADKNVRSQTMNLIVQIFDKTGQDEFLLQDLLLDKLKPIQQRDLSKLFDNIKLNGDQNDSTGTYGKNYFQWQRDQMQLEGQTALKDFSNNDEFIIDEEGDTMMELNLKKFNSSQKSSSQDIDPFSILKEQSILDKLPENFNERITSPKWKDRVEVLQEFYDNVLSKAKKLKATSQDYSFLISTLSSIIHKDANVQAVTIASQSIEAIIEKLRLPGFNKNLVTLCFVPLLERTKEKKQSVIDSIRLTLHSIVKYYNPISSNNTEDLLQEIFKFMKHKIPQVKMESTMLFNHILKSYYSKDTVNILSKYLIDEIVPIVTKVVNDTQPTIRNVGFESFAILTKMFNDTNSYEIFRDSFDKLDNLKKKKIEEIVSTLPEFTISNNNNNNNNNGLIASGKTKLTPAMSNNMNNSFLNKSTIPSKRGPSSPLKKLSNKVTPPPKSLSTTNPRIALPTKSLNVNRNPPPMEYMNDEKRIKLELEIETLKKDKQDWLKERHDMINQLNNIQNKQNELLNETELLREQLKTSQTNLHEKNLQLRSRELQLNKLQDKFVQFEEQSKPSSSNSNGNILSSTNFEARSSNFSNDHNIMSKTMNSSNNMIDQIKHTRTESASSDDLPRRVDLLQIDSSSNVNDTFVNEESWKRAAEVTSQLKARIERMRAKARGMRD